MIIKIDEIIVYLYQCFQIKFVYIQLYLSFFFFFLMGLLSLYYTIRVCNLELAANLVR